MVKEFFLIAILGAVMSIILVGFYLWISIYKRPDMIFKLIVLAFLLAVIIIRTLFSKYSKEE